MPPPSPAVAATSSISQNGVSGWPTKYASDSVGMNSTVALKMVQLRPPNRRDREGVGKPHQRADQPGTATSWNSWSVV